MSTNKVYVIQEASVKRDYSSAVQYGSLVFLLEAKFRSSRNPQQALTELRSKLKVFKPTDYILWSAGDYLSPILAGIILSELKLRYFNWLKWEKVRSTYGDPTDEGYYVPVRIVVTPEIMNNEKP